MTQWSKTTSNLVLTTFYRFSDLEEDCFGGVQNAMGPAGDFKNDYSRNAYMLVYEKRVKEKIKVVIPQSLLSGQQQLSQS